MAVNKREIALIVSILFSSALHVTFCQQEDELVVDLQANLPTRRTLPSNVTTVFRVQGISDSIDFVLLELHTQSAKLTVSLTPGPTRGSTARGGSVGAIAMVGQQSAVYFYVNSSHTAQAVIVAITYEKRAPIPGGCNNEFSLKLDPNIHLSWDENEVVMSFQYGDVGSPERGLDDRCEQAKYQSTLTYDVYQYYLPARDYSEETYFEAVNNFISSVNTNLLLGTKIKTLKYEKGQTQVKFAAYPGQGVMFGVIIRELYPDNTTSSAMYVPVTTYTCDFDAELGCQGQDETAIQVILCVLGAFGILLCFAGHNLFRFSMFTFGMLAAALVSYILLSRFTDLTPDLVLVFTGVCGLMGGGLWLTLWCFIGVPVISVLLAGLVAGFIISAAAFNLTPLGLLDIFESDFNYGMSFACGVLVIPVVLLAFTKKLSLFSCTLVGSFLIIAAIDAFVKSYMSYVVLNAVRKGAIDGFMKTVTTLPVQIPGILLLVGWGVLVLLGLILQTYTTRDQPDFPACPWDRYKERQQRQRQMEQLAVRQQEEERRPLIGQRNRGRGYGTRTPSAPQFQETPPHEGYQAMVDPL